MKTITRFLDDSQCEISIKMGQNAAENDQLFKEAKQNDIWFHLEKGSSCHIYLSIENKHIDKQNFNRLVTECENMVRENSKCHPSARVIHVEKKYVKKDYTTPGAVFVKKRA